MHLVSSNVQKVVLRVQLLLSSHHPLFPVVPLSPLTWFTPSRDILRALGSVLGSQKSQETFYDLRELQVSDGDTGE